MLRKMFLAANTPYGFKSFFSEALKDKYVYVIKGGSGVGKSTLMRNVIAGTDIDENIIAVPCSSDVNSLDVVLLQDRNIALIDGTSPHMYDPVAYGLRGEIIDLGKYISKARLAGSEGIVMAKTRQKSVLYSIMYSHLIRARQCMDNITLLYSDYVRDLGEIVKDIINTYIIGAEESETDLNCYGEVFTEDGYVADKDAVCNRAVVKINSTCLSYACDVINQLSAYMDTQGIKHEKHYSALFNEKLLSVGLKNTLITAAEIQSDYEYSLDGYIDNEGARHFLLHIVEERSAYQSAIARASEYFLDAKNCHMTLEEQYKPAMQFNKMEKDKEKLIAKILS